MTKTVFLTDANGTQHYFDTYYDNLSAIRTPPAGWTAITGGSTGANTSNGLANVWVSGFSVSGTSTTDSLAAQYNNNIYSGLAVDGGSIAVLGSNASLYNGTALYNASIEAVGNAAVRGGVAGSSGAVFAGAITSAVSGTPPTQASGPGTAYDPIVGSGGYALVGGGGNSFVVKGYYLNGNGGYMSGGTFNPGSLYGVGSGGSASGGYIGGTQAIFRNGTSMNQLFVGSSAAQFIVSNGLSSQATVISGATQYNSGGTTSGAVISNGTALVGGGTYVSFLNAHYQAIQEGYAAGTSLSNTVFSGSTERIIKDGIASNSTVLSGGSGVVSSGGTDLNPYVSGGSEIVSNGGTLLGGSYAIKETITTPIVSNGNTVGYTTSFKIDSGSGSGGLVNNGGTITISSGGYAGSAGAYDSGDIQLSSGGFGSNLSAYSGGTVELSSGGTGKTITAFSGGTALVSSGGSAGNLLVSSGGTATISPGGVIYSGGTINNSGGSLILSSGATGDYLIASQGTVIENSGASLGSMFTGNSNGTGVITQPGATAGTAIAGYDPGNSSANGGTILLSNGGGASVFGARNGGTAILGSNGTVSNLVTVSGGTASLLTGAQVLSGATALVSGGYGQSGLLYLDSGNSVTAVSLGSAGILNTNSGASIGSLFLSSGTATIGSGAYVSQMTVMNGASGIFLSGASVHHVDVNSGGSVSGAQITNGNEMVIASGGMSLNTIVTYNSGSGDLTNSAYTMISSGGYISAATIAGASSGATYGGLLTIESGATLINTSMGYNARLRIKGLAYSDNWTTSVSDGVVYVTEGGISGKPAIKWKMAVNGNYQGAGVTNTLKDSSGGGFILEDDGEGNSVLVYDKCFLAGSMIRTPRGEKAVEKLRKGEQISVYVDGREENREITAVIQRRARVDASRPADLAGWPVLVAKDAFAPGLPNADLSVTPEHCFFFEGRFVPVRMLVNGTSIRYDYSQSEYDHYHVKTEPHSVIWANDVLNESWLDTEEQDRFEPDGTEAVRLVEQESLNWEKNAAAPLDVSQAFVKPLHDRFAERAGELGLADEAATPTDGTTMDPAPYVQLENGEHVRPHRHEAGRYLFTLPPETRLVSLHSRVFRPSEAVGPHLDDRRRLGMLVGQISLWTGGEEHIITRHLTDRQLKGWNVIEAGPHRWTNGTAELPLHDGPPTSMGRQLLSIEVQAGGPYRLDGNGAEQES